MTRTTGELFVPLLLRSSARSETDGQTEDGVLGRGSADGDACSKTKALLALSHPIGNPSRDMKKLGHHRLESVAFEPAKFARPSTSVPHSRPRWLSSPAKPLVSKLGIIRRQMMGHLKFWRGSPYPVRPFRSEDGGMMRAEEGRKGRTRDPENGQSWGSRKREKEEEGRKATVKIF